MSDIAIRAATLADLDDLVRFNAAMAWETEQKRLDLDTLARGMRAVFEQPRRGKYWVAEHLGRVVGGLLITHEWSDWRCGDWWWIQSVYVVPEARRLGVFRALYREIEQRARDDKEVIGIRLYVEWENERAQNTYRSLGMTQAHYHMFERAFVTL